MASLSSDQQNIVASLRDLSEKERGEVLLKAGLGTPSQKTADRIWQAVVFSFAAIAMAVVGGLIYGRFNTLAPVDGAIYTNTETLLTVFTTVSAFLAGLLAPSPIKKE